MTQTTDNDILFSNYSRYVSIATEAADNAKESALFRNKLVTEKNIDHEQLVEAASNVHNKATIAGLLWNDDVYVNNFNHSIATVYPDRCFINV